MIFFIWRMNSRWTQIQPIYKTVPNLNQHSGYNNVPMIKTNHAFLLVFFVKEKCYYNLFRYLNEHIYIEKRFASLTQSQLELPFFLTLC